MGVDPLTVGEAMKALSYLDPAAPLFVAANYGDRGQTIQLLPVECVETKPVTHVRETAYSASKLALNEGPSDEPEAGEALEEQFTCHSVAVVGRYEDVDL